MRLVSPPRAFTASPPRGMLTFLSLLAAISFSSSFPFYHVIFVLPSPFFMQSFPLLIVEVPGASPLLGAGPPPARLFFTPLAESWRLVDSLIDIFKLALRDPPPFT